MPSDPISPSFSAKLSKRCPPGKPRNADRRSREYLRSDEVEKLIQVSKQTGRHGLRDSTMILLAYRHGLRVSELLALRWEQIDWTTGRLHVNRLKNGVPSVHPLYGVELKGLRALRKEYPDSPYLFVSERKAPLSANAFRHILNRAGELAQVGFPIHPHMLRHATGYHLASKGQDTRAIQDYLGHRNIQHTVQYTKLTSERFNSFWSD